MSRTAFAEADLRTMSLIALVARFNSLTHANATPEEIDTTADVLMRRLAVEPCTLPDVIKFKVIDRIAAVAPHLVVRPITELVDVGAGGNKAAMPYLIVVVDTSGSMSHCIAAYQASLKAWVRQRADGYCGFSVLFFDSEVYGPFSSIDCFDRVHGRSLTYAVGALETLRAVLASIVMPTDVVFMTDGQFTDRRGHLDEEWQAYKVATLPNIERFAMVFPAHTPNTAEDLHLAYLPRITPPGIRISACRTAGAADVEDVLNRELPRAARVRIEPGSILSPIGGEYVMLNNMTIFQMNKIVELLLQYPPQRHALVHNYFSHVMGMFNCMMLRAGDLLNTLRSPEMRLMWNFLQPLKKRFAQVAEDHDHFPTTSMVLEFLEAFEASVVDKRDKRLAELGKLDKHRPEVKAEIEEIRKAFNDMKKVDDYDRIVTEIARMKKEGVPSMWVRFNYTAAVAVEMFRLFPFISQDQTLEIYKMIASIGECNENEEGAMEMLLDNRCHGTVLIGRLMPYRADHEVRMTLTATQVTRLFYGFFTTQVLNDYKCTADHLKVRALLWKFGMSTYSVNILGNITNMEEPTNASPEWVKILKSMATHGHVEIPATATIADKSMWVEAAEGKMALNVKKLTTMVDAFNALHLFRIISQMGHELNVRVTTTYSVAIPDVASLVVVKQLRHQSWREWSDELVSIKMFSTGEKIRVTNGMLLQERVNMSGDEFLFTHYDRGHRLILKSGAAHPATNFGCNMLERIAVDQWAMDRWAEYKKLNPTAQATTYPVARNGAEAAKATAFLIAATAEQPPTYTRDNTHVVTPAALAHCIESTLHPAVENCLMVQFVEVEGFGGMLGDEQQKIALEVAAKYEAEGGPLPKLRAWDEVAAALPPEVKRKTEEVAPVVCRRVAPIAVVEGEGTDGGNDQKKRNEKRKRFCVGDWVALGVALGAALDQMQRHDFTAEDFMCPLSNEVFEDPVAFGGHLYERWWLEEWLRRDPRRSSPLTRETHDAVTNEALKIEEPPALFVVELAEFKKQLAARQKAAAAATAAAAVAE